MLIRILTEPVVLPAWGWFIIWFFSVYGFATCILQFKDFLRVHKVIKELRKK